MGAAKNSCITVEPIRDLKQLNDMKEYLLEHNERDYLMFVLGINSGLRISDLLKLTVEDVQDGIVTIREQKTSKVKQFALSDTCKEAINHYLTAAGLTTGTLFPSAKGNSKPISKVQAWRILNKAADWVGITENIGTHTLRKSFGYHAWRRGVDIGYLQSCFNHSSQAITMRYIGITQDELNEKVYSKMNL
ncbi:integrase [Sporomusaceae bacterium BoRhaA]|uniref:site-specific integrase n=1 Tax=Pelorhabdus rhamnosifermentans TaxID=2772457 RepID=UPI001C064724|nr:site-specific integrase [Pelorhabdus rhamnosifermentans]MBU2701165.1 integrase [Pelorhabdus rhamnosifermentans]